MNNYYLTFGKEHKHPRDPTQSLIAYWVKITAESEEVAIKVANARYGTKWLSIYPEHEFDNQYFASGELEHIQQNGKSKKNTTQS